ncbi:uncharacterized protein LOC113381830, partial [Ctenocephalides felis]|uniref:uncharacterized protein LOC113381830 n=1 Tax=Ctenocephalides felis TaxID=7515 RepID=UPI000E6E2060
INCLALSKLIWNSNYHFIAGVGEIAYARGGRGFRAALRSLKPSTPGASYGTNFDESAGGAVFYGILRAAQLVPYDSAIFLCTDRSPGDPDLAQLAATTLIRKRIRLYALWFGSTSAPSNIDDQLYESDSHGSSEALLEEAAQRSGGEWIIVRGEPAVSAQVSSEDLLAADQPDDHIATLAVRKHLHGQQAVSLNVDNSISSLHVEIMGTVSEAKLRTPNGKAIDLLNATAVAMFSDESRLLRSTRDEVEVQISLPAGREFKGEWALLTNQKNDEEYNMTVRASTAIGFEALLRRD